MKTINKKITGLVIKAESAVWKLASVFKRTDGGTTVETGTLAAGAVAIILTVVVLALSFTKDTWFPMFSAKLTEIFNMK